MAATVYNGVGNVTHTNNSGVNERIIIYWIHKDNSAVVNIYWGDLSASDKPNASLNTNTNQYVGLNLAYGMYTAGNQASMIGEKSYSSSTSIDSAPVPLELFIAPGEGFQINASGASSYIIKGYTFVVIPETN